MNKSQRFRAAVKNAGPLFMLVGTLGIAAWLYDGAGASGHLVGFAQITPEAAAPTELGRVVSIEVVVGQEVAEGQILAKLDTAAVDAEIAVAQADRVKIEADIMAEQALILQRLETDVEALQRTLALQREEQLKANAEAKVINSELSRVRKLVEDKQAVLDDLTALDLRRAAVATLVAEKPATVGLLAKQIKAAEERRQRMIRQSSATAVKLEADLALAQKRIDRLEQRRSGFVLRAQHAGKVDFLLKQPGEVVQPGEAVVRVVSARDRVVACVPENLAVGVREGDSAKLWVRGQRGEPLHGKIHTLGPTVSELPQRCWRNPRIPQWGREVTIALDHSMELVGGQAFEISLSPSATPVSTILENTKAEPRAVSNAGKAAEPLSVPSSLLAKSRFEPSGILAMPAESRYIVISDDTGKDGDEGIPWLFSMSNGGAVDSVPIAIEGVDEINDVEAISRGQEGEIYLLSSQSYSKKGKRKPSRTALLRLRPEGRGFRVDGEAHLAEIIEHSPDHGASLGLVDGTRSLDLEGMAFHKGELYIGLKAPLNERKEAMIWRVGKPSALFDGKAASTKSAEIESFAQLRLDVEVDGKNIDGGISDLAFMQDGTLIVGATPSTAEGEAGALYRVEKVQGGTLAPALIKCFPALKPEGIAVSLVSSDKLMVVFDRGATTPAFEEVAWRP